MGICTGTGFCIEALALLLNLVLAAITARSTTRARGSADEARSLVNLIRETVNPESPRRRPGSED